MPPATEPKGWQVLDRIRTLLAQVVAGDDTWYSTTEAHVVRNWDDERLWNRGAGELGQEPKLIYGVARLDRNGQRHLSGGAPNDTQNRAVLEVRVLANFFLNPSSPTDPTVGEAQILERLQADVERTLAFGDPELSVVNADDVEGEGGMESTIVQDTEEGWISVEMVFRVAYLYAVSRP